jgi:hypothetical protein
MNEQIIRTFEYVHPILSECAQKIDELIIKPYNVPFAVFETARTYDRQRELYLQNRARGLQSRHLFDMSKVPLEYATAIHYVYIVQGRWSWNVRDLTIRRWWQLFGEMVLDICKEIEWGGTWRKNQDYAHFQLKQSVIEDYIRNSLSGRKGDEQL